MNVLILGSGGREHALAWKIAQSDKLSKLFIAPGNAGTDAVGTNVIMDVNDFDTIRDFVLESNIEMVVVGPEAPLVNGITDYFQTNETLKNVTVIGPGRLGATLEGSKEFAKQFMIRNNVPTAKYKAFSSYNCEEGCQFLEELNPPYVLKADGLAGGKGVLILDDLEEAKQELRAMLLESKFGAASDKVVIEEFLDGIELSVFVLTDGKGYVILPEAKDYKRIGEGDTGLNTGGMGAISPVPFADEAFMKLVEEMVVKPTVDGFAKEEMLYNGFVFIGLMNVGGTPKVIEYNVRMGDPETEVVVPRIKSDLLDLFINVGQQTLDTCTIEIDDRTATTIMMVADGYPEAYEKGFEMTGFNQVEGSMLFHAGTKIDDGKIVTNGGRILAITSYGDDMYDALKKSYKNAALVNYEGKYYRKDIGFDLAKKPHEIS